MLRKMPSVGTKVTTCARYAPFMLRLHLWSAIVGQRRIQMLHHTSNTSTVALGWNKNIVRMLAIEGI